MKKNIQVLYANASEIGIQEIVPLFEDMDYQIIPSTININELLYAPTKSESFDLIFIDTRGMHQEMDEIRTMLDKLEIKIPIIIIVNNKEDENYFDNTNYFHIECLHRKDIHFVGMVAKHLMKEAYLCNKLQQAKTTYQKK